MRRKLLEAALDKMLPPIQFDQTALARSGRESRGPASKTTIVAFRYADGIMCVADRKTSQYGYGIFSNRSQKIYQVSYSSFLLGCGSVGSIQEIRDYLLTVCTSAYRTYGVPLSIQGQAKYAARLCNGIRRFLDGWEFSFGGILAGFSTDGTSAIYTIDEDGSRIESTDYVAMGSGGDNATVALDVLWKRAGGHSMDMLRALQLAIEVMHRASDRDSGSSPSPVMHPTVSIISDGIGMFLEDDIVKSFNRLFLHTVEHDGENDWLMMNLSEPEPAKTVRKGRGRKK